MARIRTVKPEFWDSASVGEASLRARLLFIAMWNWADDYGIGDATPIRLIGFAFPNDEVGVADFPPLREEISERFQVVFYKHEGRPYFYIPSWEKHQRTEKRAKQRIPFPQDIENVEITDVSTKVADFPTPSGGNADDGTGEQGKKERGTGEREQGTLALRAPETDGLNDLFEAFWKTYDKPVGKKAAKTKYIAAVKRGADPSMILRAAAEYIAYQRSEGKHREYSKDPVRWLGGEHWNDERAARQAAPSRVAKSTTDERVRSTLAIAERLREQEQAQQPHLRAIGQQR